MAQLQNLSLGQLLGEAEQIKSARRQNRLAELMAPIQQQSAQLGLDQARLGQTQQLARGAVSILGDAPQQNWGQAVEFVRSRGGDVTGFEQYSPENYALVQKLDSGNQQGQRGYSFGGSQLVSQNGKTGYLVPRYSQASGQIETVFAPAGEDFTVLGSGGVSAEQRAELDVDKTRRQEEEKARIRQESAQREELEKVIGREGAQRYTELQRAAQSASEFLPRLEDLQRLAATVETGATAEIRLLAKKALGIDSADMEELNARLGELAQDILNQQTGTKTDFDFQNAVRQSAALGKTPEANRRLIQALIDRQRQAVRFGDMAAQALQERGAQGILDLRYVPPQKQSAPAQAAPASPATQPAGGDIDSILNRYR